MRWLLVTDRDDGVESGSAGGGIRTEEDADDHADAEGERQAVARLWVVMNVGIPANWLLGAWTRKQHQTT